MHKINEGDSMRLFQKFNFKQNIFFYNTILIIISGFVIKLLGLTNKIFITRLLGTEGMSLYVLAFPTIILFINLSGFSLNITTSKLISESLVTKKHSPKKIIKAAISLAIKASIIMEIIYLLFLSFLVNNLLNTPNLYFPLLMTVFLIPLVGITDTLRGTFAGYQKMSIVASVNIIEQVARMVFSILGIIILSKFGIILAVSSTILALTIGELASLIFLLIKIKKISIDDINTSNNEKKVVWEMAFPTTLTRLIGSLTYFLEPILNTFILLYLGYNKNIIDYDYTVINAYIIPLLTISVFLSNALATTAVPAISENSNNTDNYKINYLINKIFFLSIIPGIIITILLYLYPKEYLNLFFSTASGYQYVKRLSLVFLLHYIQSPGIAILQALGKSKQVLRICTFFNIFKLVLIILLAFIPYIGTYTLLYAIIIVVLFESISIWLLIYKVTKFYPNFSSMLNLLLISFFCFSISLLLNLIIKSYILNSIILFILYLILIIKFKVLNLKPNKVIITNKGAQNIFFY